MPHPATSPPNTCGASAVSSWKKTRRAGQREFVLLKVIVLWPTKINNGRKKLSTENPTVKGGRHEVWWNLTPRAASSCSHLFVPILVGLLFFQTQNHSNECDRSSWALTPRFLFDVRMSILAWRFRFRRHFPKQQNSAGEKKKKRVVALVRSSKIIEENKWGWNCSRITLCHLSFPIALVTLWQAWDLQHRLPSLLRLSWVPSDHFPWDAMQITLSGFAF